MPSRLTLLKLTGRIVTVCAVVALAIPAGISAQQAG